MVRIEEKPCNYGEATCSRNDFLSASPMFVHLRGVYSQINWEASIEGEIMVAMMTMASVMPACTCLSSGTRGQRVSPVFHGLVNFTRNIRTSRQRGTFSVHPQRGAPSMETWPSDPRRSAVSSEIQIYFLFPSLESQQVFKEHEMRFCFPNDYASARFQPGSNWPQSTWQKGWKWMHFHRKTSWALKVQLSCQSYK